MTLVYILYSNDCELVLSAAVHQACFDLPFNNQYAHPVKIINVITFPFQESGLKPSTHL